LGSFGKCPLEGFGNAGISAPGGVPFDHAILSGGGRGSRNMAVVGSSMNLEGDRVLYEVAERLKRCLREEDMAARIGGDELAVLL
jgi:hypothetical protein